MRYAVIMAGGSGTRLWPLSKKGTPKQLLPLIFGKHTGQHGQGKSLLRLAYERAITVVAPENVLVVTGAAYADAVAEILPEIPGENILGEPIGRDSLNAAAWPAAVLAARDPKAVIAQLTADHLIEPMESFTRTLLAAFELAESAPNTLVTLGVVPANPHTGYGYLRRGDPVPGFADAFTVARFVEKPDKPTAEQYLASGEYWWNSGMFCWSAEAFLGQVRALQPLCHAKVVELAAHPDRLDEIFPTLPKISVDYAIMEPSSLGEGDASVLSVALDADWRDVGGYSSLASALTTDEHGNAVSGRVVALDAGDNIVMNSTPDALVAVVGVSGLVVVRTAQVTLVIPAEQSERVKELVAQLGQDEVEFA
jgi:mannose-1-phosphate guanylyltransferase